MPAWSMPTDPTGSYNPLWMTNLYGVPWSSAWNTAIYGSPTQTGADVLSNCVGWSQGEMLRWYMACNPGYDPASLQTHPFIDFNVNAGDWLTLAASKGYQILNHPEEGTVLVTSSHVANVERDDGASGWLISESGYGTLPAFNLHYSIYESGGQWYSNYASDPLILGFFRVPGLYPGWVLSGDRHHGHRARRERFRI